jgi:hypothetical protein
MDDSPIRLPLALPLTFRNPTDTAHTTPPDHQHRSTSVFRRPAFPLRPRPDGIQYQSVSFMGHSGRTDEKIGRQIRIKERNVALARLSHARRATRARSVGGGDFCVLCWLFADGDASRSGSIDAHVHVGAIALHTRTRSGYNPPCAHPRVR